ncbi:hypothetical protein [Pseudomonas laurylsulfatiphila]|jgi:hypothetical protein|uniref:hypothetical protein n=1 Tax=Pseudomonas laurylsulfatiphila TaxID=2011015 RepID=UPI003D1A2EAE
MEKIPPPEKNTHLPRRGGKSVARAATSPPHQQSMAGHLIELRPGFFLNADHIVSVRVLPQEEGDVYAVLYLSNGDKQNLTPGEFTVITGKEPRAAARLVQKTQMD